MKLLSKLLRYELNYDKMQIYNGVDNLELLFIDTESFNPYQLNFFEDLKHFSKDVDFRELGPSHELFSSRNKNVTENMNLA